MRHSFLSLWHLLSLDAPTVAALWTIFIARCSGVALPWQAPAAMFLAVWILYAADRLLDARTGPKEALEPRHHFHDRHRSVFVIFIAIAAVLLAALTPHLNAAALRLYALLGGLLCGWFLLIHTRLASERRLPKELVVGIFFAAAVFIPTVARRPELRLQLIVPAVLFAALCALNCMFLYAWEHPGARTHAHSTTRLLTKYLVAASLLLIIASLLCALSLSFEALSTLKFTLLAYAMSTMFLLALHRARQRLSELTLRAAADLALLTPLLLIWLPR